MRYTRSAHAHCHRLRRPHLSLPASFDERLRRCRYRVPARADLLAAALPRPAGHAGRSAHRRSDGARHRPFPVLGADGERARRQGVPRRAPGHRDRVRQDRPRAAPRFRHADRGDGVRLRRIDLLRQPREEGDGRRPRQVLALHRLEPAPAVGEAASLRPRRRDAPARRLPALEGRDRGGELFRVAQRGDGSFDRLQDVRVPTPRTPGSA